MDVKRLMSQMQNQFAQAQKHMDSVEVSSLVGGEEGVDLKMNGKFEVKDLKVNFLPKDKEDLEILEDMLKKAYMECHEKVTLEIKKKTGGMF